MVVAMEARTVRPERGVSTMVEPAPNLPARANRAAPRPESPARWAAALRRAMEAGVDLLEIGGSEMVAVESARHPGVVYLVSRDGTSCSCRAGEWGDPVCLHRALVLWLTGRMDADGRPPRPECCPECSGTGRRQYWTGEGGLSAFVDLPCPRCRAA